MPEIQSRYSGVKRALLLTVASNAAVLFVLGYGSFFWPEGLPAHSQNIFWLASGVNLAGLLILGLRFWPVLLLNAVPAWLITGEPLDLTALGSLTNAAEALLAAWLILRLGKFVRQFDRMGSVGALLIASVVAPFVNTVVIPAYFCSRGVLPWGDYGKALANWNLANGAGMLLLAPLLVACLQGAWHIRGRIKEAVAVAAVALGFCLVAFDAVFSGAGMNYVFIVFPVVIYAAVRFGGGEMSAVLGMVLFALYLSLAVHAHALPPQDMVAAIWFLQAFCWVLAATGLLVAALVAERRRAECILLAERERAVEISLREQLAQLDVLRYQLDPHFLFNSLNSISATLPDSGAETSRRMVTQLAGFLRSTLARQESDVVSLAEELYSMEQYLDIERIRFGEDLQCAVFVDEESRARMVPIFLLQPLVENAIVHGFGSSQGVFHLRIHAAVENGMLNLEVANTGRWKTPSAEGIGLSNTRRRLELIYGTRACLDIHCDGGWVRVRIQLPSDQGTTGRAT